jgi:membrane-associated phospholipid phosphatase
LEAPISTSSQRATPWSFARHHQVGVAIVVLGLIVTCLTPQIDHGFWREVGRQTTEPKLSPYNVALTLGIIALLSLAYAAKSRAAFLRVTIVMLTETALYGLIKLITWKGFHLFPRPSHGDGGFPSGHTAAVCALAYLLTERWPRAAPLWYACAAFIGWCRWASGAHYPYQVVAGAILGLTVAIVLTRRFPEAAGNKTNSAIYDSQHRV